MTDYAKIAAIAEAVWHDADDFPNTPSELKSLLTTAARIGYERARKNDDDDAPSSIPCPIHGPDCKGC